MSSFRYFWFLVWISLEDLHRDGERELFGSHSKKVLSPPLHLRITMHPTLVFYNLVTHTDHRNRVVNNSSWGGCFSRALILSLTSSFYWISLMKVHIFKSITKYHPSIILQRWFVIRFFKLSYYFLFWTTLRDFPVFWESVWNDCHCLDFSCFSNFNCSRCHLLWRARRTGDSI